MKEKKICGQLKSKCDCGYIYGKKQEQIECPECHEERNFSINELLGEQIPSIIDVMYLNEDATQTGITIFSGVSISQGLGIMPSIS